MTAKLTLVHTKQQDDPCAKENAEWVRDLLANVQPLRGCCFCGNESFHAGRAAVERIALAIERQDDTLLPSANECIDILDWLSCIEPVNAKRYCHGHSGKGGITVLLHTVHDVLAGALEEAEQ